MRLLRFSSLLLSIAFASCAAPSQHARSSATSQAEASETVEQPTTPGNEHGGVAESQSQAEKDAADATLYNAMRKAEAEVNANPEVRAYQEAQFRAMMAEED